MRLTLIRKKSRGFTLVEVMVAIGICGVLAAIAIPNYLKHRQKGLIGRATGDLKYIQRKIQDLGHDTGKWPTGNTAGEAKSMSGGNEIEDLSDPDCGLTANGGGWADWQGPYMTGPFKDPWGKPYFFDEDYRLPDGRTAAVVGSTGPDMCCVTGPKAYDDNNIILIIPAN